MIRASHRIYRAATLARRRLAVGVALVLVAGVCGLAVAYDQYSVNKDATNCRACHGDFRSTSYNSLKDGTVWTYTNTAQGTENGLHNVHRRSMLDGECNACHGSGPSFPVMMGESVGGSGLGGYGCSGCHGRQEDWTGNTGNQTEGWGAGLRQHHWNADALHPTMDLKVCATCHEDRPGGLTDADPANYTPVGENVNPPHYGTTYGSAEVPNDACNPATPNNYPEDFTAGANLGLDNDGDGVYDSADSDCSAATGAGESLGLTAQKGVTAGVITLSWTAGCNDTEHKIEYGDLANVSAYTYAGQECNLTTPAGYDWLYPVSPQNLFILVVTDNGSSEGSYGTCSPGVGCGTDDERPDDDVNTTCSPNLDQDLSSRCD